MADSGVTLDLAHVQPEARAIVERAARVYVAHTRPWLVGLLLHGSAVNGGFILGCSDVDPHVPSARVEASAQVLRRLGADVTMRLYAGMGHTVNADELAHARAILAAVAGAA